MHGSVQRAKSAHFRALTRLTDNLRSSPVAVNAGAGERSSEQKVRRLPFRGFSRGLNVASEIGKIHIDISEYLYWKTKRKGRSVAGLAFYRDGSAEQLCEDLYDMQAKTDPAVHPSG